LLLAQLGKGEFRRSVDGDEEMELSFYGPHFGNIDREEADRVSLELLPRGLVPLDIWQMADDGDCWLRNNGSGDVLWPCRVRD
jgi:hypothetical protein